MAKNLVLQNFGDWMTIHRNLSSSTIEKYTRAVNTVSKDMIELGIINENLLDMSLTELDLAISLILCNKDFNAKNKKGNHMYSNGLKQFRYFVLDTVDEIDTKEIEIVKTIETDSTIRDTEKVALVKSRIGQGDFRKSLFKKYEGRCIVTGVDLTKLLIASHIKPWSVSENDERISPENGLLLSANYDRLFDSGLISFKDDGKMIISSFVNQQNKNILGLNNDIMVDLKSSSAMLKNLEYHRDVVFVA